MTPEEIQERMPVFLAEREFAARNDILFGIMDLAGIQISARKVNSGVYCKEKFWITRLMNQDEAWINTGSSSCPRWRRR